MWSAEIYDVYVFLLVYKMNRFAVKVYISVCNDGGAHLTVKYVHEILRPVYWKVSGILLKGCEAPPTDRATGGPHRSKIVDLCAWIEFHKQKPDLNETDLSLGYQTG